MKRSSLVLIFLCGLLTMQVYAQRVDSLQWWNPATNSFPVIEGQGWPGEGEQPYDRLPARAKPSMKPDVWYLSHNGAGLYLKFQSDAAEIVVRYVVQNKGSLGMPHMPATGVSGVDLYALDHSGAWQWARGKYAFGDTIEYRFSHLEADHVFKNKPVEYRLYLPLYNTVNWLAVGVAQSKKLIPMPLSLEKPVVVYGTSIAQGGCASRPGMAWTALLNRSLDRPLINLGFSGSGRLEKPVLDLMAEKDAKLYILDCVPNLSASTVAQLVTDAVQLLQTKRPGVPILLAAHSGGVPGSLMDTALLKDFEKANTVLQATYEKLIAAGKKDLYILSATDIGFDINSTVDGVHPTDVGMLQYAAAYEKIIRRILKEPQGNISTTIPVTQSRDGAYNWRARHQEILALNKTSGPSSIVLANSIIHYWGGEPVTKIVRGEDAWNKYMAPFGMRNLAFGWDRIENVLWRVYHDELDGYAANNILVMIGTNNLGSATDAEIITGLQGLVEAIQVRQPKARVLLAGILPRRAMEPHVVLLNKQIALLARRMKITFINPGTVLLDKQGKIIESLFSDGLHPIAAGYEVLGKKLQESLKSK
ncbi:hypothetical protein MMC2321_02707 [Chitinophaga sp. MM2321]